MSAPRHTRSIVAIAALLLGGLLTSCGEDSSGQDPTGVAAGGGLSELDISGDFGQEPELTWNQPVTVTETESETLIEGEGASVETGDLVLANVLVANGVDEKVVTSDFAGQSQLITVSDGLIAALKDSLTGATVGSRVVVAAPPADAFGDQGNPQLGIGNADTVVFLLDIAEIVPSKPSGTEQEPEAWMPQVQDSDGVPSGLSFADTPKPTSNLRVGYLIKGDGKEAAAGDQVAVNYLGQVYGGKEPFDESFSGGQPFSFALGEGQVVKGWDQGLAGVPAGSRVILAIPPKLGYGQQGQGDIKGTDTMYFVVDVLSAS